jgi:hypothetical protein
MAKPTWVCAGCDVQFKLRKIDKWRMLSVEILSASGSPRLSETFELCPACQQRIVTLADPRTWARPDSLTGEVPQALAASS